MSLNHILFYHFSLILPPNLSKDKKFDIQNFSQHSFNKHLTYVLWTVNFLFHPVLLQIYLFHAFPLPVYQRINQLSSSCPKPTLPFLLLTSFSPFLWECTLLAPTPLTSILSLILFPSPQHLSKFSYAPSWARGRLFWLHFPLWFLFSLSFLHHLCLWWYCLENTITSYQFHVLFLCTIPLLSVFWLYHLNITRFSVTT